MIGDILSFSTLDFSYDPIGSWRKNYEKLDREYLFFSLSELLSSANTVAQAYCIFGKSYVKKNSDSILCIDNGEQLTFVVSVIERGRRQDISVHSNCYLALNDFLFRALKDKPFYYLKIDPTIRYAPEEKHDNLT